MKQKPTVVAKRLTELFKGHLSQAKLAARFNDVEQSAIFRYENTQSFLPYNILMLYADFLTYLSIIFWEERISHKENYTTISLM